MALLVDIGWCVWGWRSCACVRARARAGAGGHGGRGMDLLCLYRYNDKIVLDMREVV